MALLGEMTSSSEGAAYKKGTKGIRWTAAMGYESNLA